MEIEDEAKRRLIECYSEELGIFGKAEHQVESAFKRIDKSFRHLRQVEAKHRDKMIWQMFSGIRKNDHLPGHLLDESGDIKSVMDTFEHYFPDEERYTQAERADAEFASYLEENILTAKREEPVRQVIPCFRRELLDESERFAFCRRRE